MNLGICEKPSQCKQVAEGLGLTQKNGYFQGVFNGETFVLISLAGHVLKLKEPNEINPSLQWGSLEGITDLPTNIPRIPNTQKSSFLNNASNIVRKFDFKCIYTMTDPDRSGAAIAFTLIHELQRKKQLNHNIPIKVAWFSQGLNKSNVQQAVKRPMDFNFGYAQFEADNARAISDYYWMYLVRAYTYFGKKGALSENLGSGGSKSSVVSVGRVQSALVGLIKHRDHLVKTYKPKKFYNISIFINGSEFKYKHEVSIENYKTHNGYIEDRDNVYFTDEKQMLEFKNRLLKSGKIKFTKVDKKPFDEHPPDVFSSKQMWNACTKQLSFGVKKTQTIAEALYREGFISYPRTKGTHIPLNDFSLEFIERRIKCNNEKHKELIQDVLNSINTKNYTPNVFRNSTSAHEGIIPTGKSINDFNGNSKIFKECKSVCKASNEDILKVFDVIYIQFCHSCLQPAKGFKANVLAEVDSLNLKGTSPALFKTSSQFYVSLGHLSHTNEKASIGSESKLFSPTQGESVSFETVKQKTSKTSKYTHYTEETLPQAMFNISKNVDNKELADILKKADGIGTEATIVQIIDTVLAREYVANNNGTFTITQKGLELINVIDPLLCSPQLTAAWEQKLFEITEAENAKTAVQLRDEFTSKQRYFLSSTIEKVITNFTPLIGTFKTYQIKGDGKPSAKQIKYAKHLSETKKIPLSPKTLSSSILISKFINKATGKS